MSTMFPAPGSDRRRLEEIVGRNCVHNASGYAKGSCVRTNKDLIAKCPTHELLGTFEPERLSKLDRYSRQHVTEALPSWCSVLSFYKWLLERNNGTSPLGARVFQLGGAEPMPDPEPLPQPDPSIMCDDFDPFLDYEHPVDIYGNPIYDD